MTRPASTLPRRLGVVALAVALLSAAVPASASPASASSDDSPVQIIDPNQQQGTGQVVIPARHADFGPTFGTGEWALQIHDDTATPRYWRDPDDVVFHVGDAALLEVPDDDAFAFLQLPARASVYVVPQTEQPGVPWIGWNTQEPTLLESLSLGSTLRIHAIEGPGDVVTYLQGGNFAAPQPLWTTHEPFPQEAWIEINTHTHANWVFSEPGVYLVDAEFTGDLVTGESLSARGTLRFAVGDATDPADAFAASLTAAPAATEAPGGAGAEAGVEPEAGGNTVWYLVGGGAVILAVVLVTVVVASARARRRARTNDDGAKP